MTKLNRAGQPNSLGDIDTTQGTFQSQINALTDTIRQLSGRPQVQPSEGSDPLSAPYVLYVDPVIGSDTFVSGDYVGTDDGTYESKMRRISLQRLECGYSVNRPFRSIPRAVIEAGIITSRDYLNLTPAPCGDLVTIVIGSGVHTLLNGPGDAADVQQWTDGYVPTPADLQAFSGSNGGVVLPRGCSLVSLDLRKTIIRPDYVPTSANENPDLSNRSQMFLLTGGNYVYGFTLMDKTGLDASHHLLTGFAFAGLTELDDFYSKIRTAFNGADATGDINPAYAVPRTSEYIITGPQPPTPSEPTDTVQSSSPYIYNISMRSEYGMCGMIADGSLAAGSFKSMVVSQYTGVSLQRDLTCWQKYEGGEWTTFDDYPELIAEDPNNVRYNPLRQSFHVRTLNGAVVQEVSVFAIGHALHHVAESGSQITITNSNSNWGGCAALATGFDPQVAPGDSPWDIQFIKTAVDPFDKGSNKKYIYLGILEDSQGNTATTLTLQEGLNPSLSEPTQPNLLAREGYSLSENDYVWVENPLGPDYRARLAATPWTTANPSDIVVKTEVQSDNASGNVNPSDADVNVLQFADIAGKRLYIRRLRDVREVSERRYSFVGTGGTNTVRQPIRDYVIQPTAGDDWTAAVQAVAASEPTNQVFNGSNVELRYSKRPNSASAFSSTVYYRKADVVRRSNKHWSAIRDNYGTWDEEGWSEMYVHMPEDYAPEGYYTNAQPILTFDKDTSEAEASVTLGNSLTDPLIVAQYTSAVDYEGLYYLLLNLGVGEGAARTYLTPQSVNDRDIDVASENWIVEFRRPTNIRLFAHAYEWSGRGNYTKGLPQYQGELTPNNQFSFYFTNEDGGKVYATGFNEEGLKVTPRGLEDLTTGKVLGVSDIGSPDLTIDFPSIFTDLEVTNNFTLGGLVVTGEASVNRFGFVELASLAQLNSPSPATDNDDINSDPTAVTPEGLAYWADQNRLVSSLPTGVPYALLHVCSASTPPLTGAASVPYGLQLSPELEWQQNGNVFQKTIFRTLTEAVEKASTLFLPTGSTIVISIHDDLGANEAGPIQLVNGLARFDVIGARGAIAPTVRMKWGTTENACARIPQYTGAKAFSAGAVFADLTLELDCNNSNDISATFNGGYGIGGRDTIINWNNAGDYVCAATCRYGGEIAVQFYNTDGGAYSLANNLVSSTSSSLRLNLTGSDSPNSGLTGHGCNLIVDIREPSTQGGFAFSNSTSSTPKVSLIDLGKRGGVKNGGRVVPQFSYDFNNDNFDLSELVGINYARNQNYQGKSFRAEVLVGSAQSTYNINSSSLATVTPLVLTNGNCLDAEANSDLAPAESGFASLLMELERDPSITGLLLTADNATNAYIYNSQIAGRNV